MVRDKNFRLNVVVVVLLHLVFLLLQLSEGVLYLKDSSEYLWLARNLREGFIYSSDPSAPVLLKYFTLRPPVYGIFLSIFKFITTSDIPAIIAQNILSIINTLVILRLLQKEGKKVPFYLLFLLLLFIPSQFIYANLIMAEILLQTFLVWSFWFYYRYLESADIKYLYLVSLMLTLAVLTKPVVLVFLIAYLVLSGAGAIIKKRYLILIPAILPLLVVFSYSWINYERTGYFHYSSITSHNLLNYNGYYLLKKVHGREEADLITDEIEEKSSQLPFRARQDFIRGTVVSMIFEHPFDYLALHIKGMANFFIDPGRFDIYKMLGLTDPERGLTETFAEEGYKGVVSKLSGFHPGVLIYLACTLIVNLVLTAGFIYFVFTKPPRIWWYPLLILLCIVFATGIIGAARFRVPVIQFLIFGFFMVRERIPLLRKA